MRMTIDEAIAHAREVARESRENIINGSNLEPYESYCNVKCEQCSEEHEQLANWLEELKLLKEEKKEFQIIARDNYETVYDTAINDFVEEFSIDLSESIIWGLISNKNSLNDKSDMIVDYVISEVNRVADKLKDKLKEQNNE